MEMTGADKANAHARLEKAKAKLDQHWAQWKGQNQRAYEARQANRQAHNAAFEAKQAEWRSNQRAFIERQEEGISKLIAARGRREDHLDELRGKFADAHSEGYRERVSSWIDEERDRIRDIDAKISSARAKLDEARSRL